MTDKTENLPARDKIERLLKSARSVLLSERDRLSGRVREIQTGSLNGERDIREYESVLEELNRYQYTADMLDMLIKYL